MDIVRVDPQAFPKNQKRHFFRDIEKSFQGVTPKGPEPHQFFSFWNISTNTIARDVQWTHVGQMDSCWTTWVHWLQQIFSHLSLNQKWIEISAWNFQHLFITCLCKFDKKTFGHCSISLPATPNYKDEKFETQWTKTCYIPF